MIFIDRKRKKEAMSIMTSKVEQLKISGTKVVVFPEGGIYHESVDFLPFKKGAFVAAIESQVIWNISCFRHYFN